jgi:hypothetical protein
MKKLHNGQVVDMTAEEVTELENLVAEANGHRQAEETAKQAKATAQASGNQKLLDLGLTQAEATALTGYTPPTEA